MTAAPPAPRTTVRPAPTSPITVVLAAVALLVLSWVVVTYPYRGDQAIFALLGRQWLQGAIPYVQLWDVKQPGVLLWYGLTDLLGLGEAGSRVLDVVATFALGLIVASLVRSRLTHPGLRRWVPLLAAGAVLLAAGPGDFGQIELLGLVPSLGAFVLVDTGRHRRLTVGRLLGAGLCLGLMGVLKLPLAAVPGVALLVMLALRLPRRQWLRTVALLAAGAAVPLLAVCAWLAVDGALGAALHTWFVDSVAMGATPGSRSLPRLLEGAGRYVAWTAPVAVAAAWQAVVGIRGRDPLDIAMATWIVLDVLAVSGQFGWWYQWYFLTGPLLVLAARRADALLTHPPVRRRALAIAAACAVAAPMLAHGAVWLGGTVLDGGGLTAASRERIDDRVADYDTVRGEAAAAGLRPEDSLYVLGDPLYNYLTDHPLTVRTDGWAYDLMAAYQWDDLAGEIRASRPAMVFLQEPAPDWVRDRGPAVTRELARDYDTVRVSSEGVWYRLRG
jgi:hypothetical protein